MSILKKVAKRGTIPLRKTILGYSSLGNIISVFKPSLKKKKLSLFIAGIHGDEPESVVFLSAALRSINTGNLSSYVIPCLNPDGVTMGTRANNMGVDLNRNFPSNNWSQKKVKYAWSSKESQKVELSSGSFSCSEEESKLLVNFIIKHGIKRVISIHAPLNFIESASTSSYAKDMSKRFNIPFVEESNNMPGSLASWCNDLNIDIITLELPSISIDSIISDYSPILIQYLTNFD